MWIVKYLDRQNHLMEARVVCASNAYKVAKALYLQVGYRVAIVSKVEIEE